MTVLTKHRLSLLVFFAGLAASAQAEETALDKSLESLLARAERVIAKVHARPLSSERNTPWAVMHAVIAYEKDLWVLDTADGKKVGGIEYLCRRAKYDGKRIFRDNRGQPALPTRGLSYGMRASFKVQDHVDQFLMTFADAGVSLKEPIVAEGGRKFTVGDMLAASQANMTDSQEVGWTLVVAATYLPLDAKWKARSGKQYTLEGIAAIAIRRDPRRETEGGPHHLYGVAYALEKYRAKHEGPLSGTWAAARAYLDQYAALAKKYQLDDGAFSVAMFRGSRAASSPRQMVWATGHTIEWLCVALTAEQLREAWVQKGVAALLAVMEKTPIESLSEGGLYHAAHALRRYKEKVGGKQRGAATAGKPAG